jgi:hypothetical protein
VALNADDTEPMVVYGTMACIWVRPLSEFIVRFEKVFPDQGAQVGLALGEAQ